MSPRGYAGIVCAYMVACLVLGGASAAGVIANGILQLAAIGVALIAMFRLTSIGLSTQARLPLAILCAVLLLGPLQLVPLPPGIWSGLPGREPVASGLDLLGVPRPWLSLSLAPELTWRSTLALLPAAAAFLATLALDIKRRTWLAWSIVGVALLAFALGLAQSAGGTASPLYFYEITNWGSAVGFFPNRNHMATLDLVALPLLAALIGGQRAPRRPSAPFAPDARALGFAMMLLLIVDIVATGSRAGLALLFPALVLTFALMRRNQTGIVSAPIVAGAGLLSALAIGVMLVGPGAARIMARTSGMAEDDIRFSAAPATFEAAMRYMPFGTGLGSFDRVYRMAAAGAPLTPNYVNHAHDDYLELALTAGIPGLLLLGVFAFWFVGATAEAWKQRQGVPGALPRAGAVIVALVALHSAVDYPLRTAAISSVFAVACALMVQPSQRLRQSGALSGGTAPRAKKILRIV